MAETKKRLPRNILGFKREIKALPFDERVKIFFNCNSIFDERAEKKKEIILKSFSPEERDEFSGKYRPIQIAIEAYADRVRTLKVNSEYFSAFLSNVLRSDDACRYTADWINSILGKVGNAIKETKEEDTKSNLRAILKDLMRYRQGALFPLSITFSEKEGGYIVKEETIERDVRIATDKLITILCAIKSFLASLREFLQWVGEPQLFPEEFKQMEEEARRRYPGPQESKPENPEIIRRFPLYWGERNLGKEFLAINYDELPLTLDIFKSKNLWANTYRKLFI